MKKILFLSLVCLSAHAFDFEIFRGLPSTSSHECTGNYRRLTLTSDLTYSESNTPVSGRKLVDEQWEFLDDPYKELFDKLGIDYKLMETLAKHDQESKIPDENQAYIGVKDERGRWEGWMRIVSNSPSAGALLKGSHNPKPGILPTETKRPRLAKYFDKHFPRRVEAGRIATRIDLGDQRLAVLSDLFSTAALLLHRPGAKEPMHMILEVPDLRKKMYSGYGFKEISREDMLASDPDLKLEEGWSWMEVDVKDLYDQMHGGVREALENYDRKRPHSPIEVENRIQRIDAAVAKIDSEKFRDTLFRARFEKAKAFLELRRLDDAEKQLVALEKRTSTDIEVQRLRFTLEMLKRFDPQTSKGDVGKALAFVQSQSEIGSRNMPFSMVPFTAYHRAWLSFESGSMEEAKAFVRSQTEDLLLDGKILAKDLAREYSPETGTGTLEAIEALHSVDHYLNVPPFALTPDMHLYRAGVLTRLGRHEDAEKARAKAKRLQGIYGVAQ